MRRRTLLASGAAALVPAGVLATPGVALASTDYGPAAWVPAHSATSPSPTGRSSHNINYVVIHTTQGSYNGTISWFQNPASQVSAHYVVKSSDGAVTQMVREKDIAWHAGNWTYNTQSIGIEHEGFVEQDGWYTEAHVPVLGGDRARVTARSTASRGPRPHHRPQRGTRRHPHRPGPALELVLLHVRW